MGLSVRQTVCGLLAAGLAAAANFGLQPFLGTELASVVCILAAAIPAISLFAVAFLNVNPLSAKYLMIRSTGDRKSTRLNSSH